jgi:uncharacterized protein YyaL (SSP411 family)
MMALAQLVHLTGQEKLKRALDAAVAAFTRTAQESSALHVHYLSVLLTQQIPHRQIVIVARRDDAEAMDTYHRIVGRYVPFSSVIYYDQSDEMEALFPELKSYRTDNVFTGYVCENFTCGTPVHSARELLSRLNLEKYGTV